jgi:hypothetical protein
MSSCLRRKSASCASWERSRDSRSDFIAGPSVGKVSPTNATLQTPCRFAVPRRRAACWGRTTAVLAAHGCGALRPDGPLVTLRSAAQQDWLVRLARRWLAVRYLGSREIQTLGRVPANRATTASRRTDKKPQQVPMKKHRSMLGYATQCWIMHKRSAERTGFEPAEGFDPFTGLANRRIRPLCHLSQWRTESANRAHRRPLLF